jgi:6-pyruvoyltetrahydropterin/6-carboxytetrahydropterin synthase
MKKYFVAKTFPASEFSCVFRQWRAESHCRFLHGYAIQVDLEFEADSLDARNWVVDFGGFRSLKEDLKRFFDHKLIIAQDDPMIDALTALESFGLAEIVIMENVGCEAFAEFIAGIVKKWLADLSEIDARKIWLSRVVVREHQSNAAGLVWR